MSMPTAIVPARGNSKGIPGKNLTDLGGRPLLAYTLDAAAGSGVFDRVVVSSESPEVRRVAGALGAEALRRPPHLSADHVHTIHVVLHALDALGLPDDEMVAMLLPTSPLRLPADVTGAVDRFRAGGVDSVVSVYRSGHHLMHFRTAGEDGLLAPVGPGRLEVQRQEMDPLYVLNGSVYVSTAGHLRRRKSYHLGRVAPWIMDEGRSIDVDTAGDLARAALQLAS